MLGFKETKLALIDSSPEGISRLNQYTFQEELGRGSYSIARKAVSIDTGEVVAIKVVDKSKLKRVRVGRFGNALQGLRMEIDIWKRLHHPHIIMLKEVIDDEALNMLFMVSELADGPVLTGERECVPLNQATAIRYFCHLIRGIEFLHDNKLLHRDIKPENLLLVTKNHETTLKIADFGVSQELNDDETLRQTAGTPYFHAPEMLTGESFYGKPTDVWSCGITLYLFIYGRTPYQADRITELYSKILNDSIEYPVSVNGEAVDDNLIDLMQKILVKDPTQRYTTRQIRTHASIEQSFSMMDGSAFDCD